MILFSEETFQNVYTFQTLISKWRSHRRWNLPTPSYMPSCEHEEENPFRRGDWKWGIDLQRTSWWVWTLVNSFSKITKYKVKPFLCITPRHEGGCGDKSQSVLNLRRNDQLCPQPPLYLERKSHLNPLSVRNVNPEPSWSRWWRGKSQ
jgi:hypothetical protein